MGIRRGWIKGGDKGFRVVSSKSRVPFLKLVP